MSITLQADEQSVTLKRPLITSIAVLLLKDFKTCCIDHDLSILGDGTPAELEAAYNDLLSQFYEAKKDPDMLVYIKLGAQIKAYEVRKTLINAWVFIMNERYSEECSKVFRMLYPNYKFTSSSYLADIRKVLIAEKRKKLDYDRLLVAFDERKAKHIGEEVFSVEQRHRNFIYELMDINKIEGVKYDAGTMTTLEYAIALNRKQEYIETLKSQTNNGRG